MRHDVQTQVLFVAVDGRTLQPGRLARFEPLPPGLGDGRGLAGRDVDVLADVDGDLRLASVRVLFALERLNVPGAVDAVVDNPGFLRLSLSGRPRSFANGHCMPL